MAAKGSPRTRRWRRVVWYTLLVVFLGVGVAFVYRRYHGRDQRDCMIGEMYLERGNTGEALQQFRAALEVNPKLTEARVGIIRALVLRREFAEALEEVDQAVENGLAESEAALLKARVFPARANNRIETAGKDITVKICEQAVDEDVDPAIALVQQQAEKAEKPADAYTLLGILRQKLQIEKDEESLLVKAYQQARDLDKKDEMAAREQDVRALALKMRSVRTFRARRTGGEQEGSEPPRKPRIALAQDALNAYNPRTDEAKTMLEPLMKVTPPARGALPDGHRRMVFRGRGRRAGAHSAPDQYAGAPARIPR